MIKLNVNIIDVLGELEIGVSGKEGEVPDRVTAVEKSGVEVIQHIVKNKFKVIGVDNYDRDTVDDILVCVGVTEFYGKLIVNALNATFAKGTYFYKLVPMGHVLYKWEQT